MSLLCYHASHEQFAPSELLRYAILAEKAGFEGIHSSDHFNPWSARQGQSGYSFSWIAAALQATSLPFSMVCAPGQRYHPAIVAQAIATLDEMFPDRINVELGSGEALNEIITGESWPSKAERNERLLTSAQLIRELLNGKQVDYSGSVTIHHAKLYTLPKAKPLLLCAAISKETAEWAGTWADGLLTTCDKTIDTTSDKIKAFKKNGGNNKPIYVQFAFSYSQDRSAAEEGAFDQWRSNILPREKLADFYYVEQFDAAAEDVTPEQVLESVPVFTSIQSLMKELKPLIDLNVDRIILHNINRMQEEFINDYGHYHAVPSGVSSRR